MGVDPSAHLQMGVWGRGVSPFANCRHGGGVLRGTPHLSKTEKWKVSLWQMRHIWAQFTFQNVVSVRNLYYIIYTFYVNSWDPVIVMSHVLEDYIG